MAIKKKSRGLIILTCLFLAQLAFAIFLSIPNAPSTPFDPLGVQEINDGRVSVYPSTQSIGYPVFKHELTVTLPLDPTTVQAELRLKFLIQSTPDLHELTFSLLFLNGSAMIFEDVYEGYSAFSASYNGFDGSQVVGIKLIQPL